MYITSVVIVTLRTFAGDELSGVTLYRPMFALSLAKWFYILRLPIRGSSASQLCINIIACCPTHPSINHRWSSFFQTLLPDCGTLCRWTSRRHSSISVFRKHLMTHLFSHSSLNLL